MNSHIALILASLAQDICLQDFTLFSSRICEMNMPKLVRHVLLSCELSNKNVSMGLCIVSELLSGHC